MGGPALQFDPNISSPFRWPRAFDGQPLFYEWSRDYAKVMQLNRPNGHQLADIVHLFGGKASENPNVVLDNPMDMEFGPDGALYVLEYGTGYFAELPAAQLARIDYVRGGQYTPVVRASATPASGTTPPLTVQFSSAGTVGRQRRPAPLRVGLRLQRDGRLHRGQPDLHLHGARRLSRPRCG